MREIADGIGMLINVVSFISGAVISLGGYLFVKWIRSKWEIRKK